MTRLNQIIAIEKGAKSSAFSVVTSSHNALKNRAPLSGIARTYRPKDDEGEQLPSESTRVQTTVKQAIADVEKALIRLFDVTATKEEGNTRAKANVVVDGKTILTNVPATTLLFLEKQLIDIHEFVKELPTLDAAETWHHDSNTGVYTTQPVETTRTKKVPRNHVKAEATDKHPAQVEVYHEDVVVGYWKTVKFSGALPQSEVTTMLERVEKLQAAVKFAREEANNVEVTDQHIGQAVFSYVLGK